MHDLPFAEDVNYWKTGKSDPDSWIDHAIALIKQVGGVVLRSAFGHDHAVGRQAYLVEFTLGGEPFKIVWPVLPTRGGEDRAAKRQAATMLYHDVKAKCVSAAVLGTRAAFFTYLVLPDGRTAAEVATPALADALPSLFRQHQLPGGDIVDGEMRELKR